MARGRAHHAVQALAVAAGQSPPAEASAGAARRSGGSVSRSARTAPGGNELPRATVTAAFTRAPRAPVRSASRAPIASVRVSSPTGCGLKRARSKSSVSRATGRCPPPSPSLDAGEGLARGVARAPREPTLPRAQPPCARTRPARRRADRRGWRRPPPRRARPRPRSPRGSMSAGRGGRRARTSARRRQAHDARADPGGERGDPRSRWSTRRSPGLRARAVVAAERR